MGQQQLLLIVLGVIIVGIAVVVGINVFTASSVQANSDALVADCTNLAAMAQQYYRKPTALGGGGNKFAGWTVPASLQRTANMGADVTAVVEDELVTLTATGTESGPSGTPITVTMKVAPSKIDTTIITTD